MACLQYASAARKMTQIPADTAKDAQGKEAQPIYMHSEQIE